MIRHLLSTAALLALSAAAAAAPAQTPPAAPDGKALETRFDASISSADQLGWLREMASAPNQVGSPHDKANAEMQLALFRRWGWDARIEPSRCSTRRRSPPRWS